MKPDLTCLGKIIGGGLPVGAYGGRADLMELVAPAGPVYQAGTLSGNPLAMTAGLWSLERAVAEALYRHLARLGAGSRRASPTPRARPAWPLQVNAFGSLLTPFFTDAAGPRLPVGAHGRHGGVRPVLPRRCSRAASIRRRRSSRRGSCRPRTREKDVDKTIKAAQKSDEGGVNELGASEPVQAG